MKKILVLAAFMAATSFAFADTTTSTTSVDTASNAVSKSQGGAGGAGGAVSGVTATNGLTVGCLVNCASTDQGTKDLADSAVQSALIQAQAARDVADTTVKIKNTPSVSGPALTSSNDTCMGSSSGSANVPGIGIGFGTSWVDANCKMLKNAREFWNMGMKSAAMKLMCKDADNRDALMATGFDCDDNSQSVKKKNEVAAASAAAPEQFTDPLIRSRLGLAPLATAK